MRTGPLIIITIALAAAVSFSSCGSSTETKPAETVKEAPAETAGEITIEETAEAETGKEETAEAETEEAETAEAEAAEAAEAAGEDALFPTEEPLTMPAVIPPQHTAAAQMTDQARESENHPPASQKAAVMQVVNCKEWISLRVMPSTSADTIARIPLGEQVVWIAAAENGFYQISYQGRTGYALAEYLALVQ